MQTAKLNGEALKMLVATKDVEPEKHIFPDRHTHQQSGTGAPLLYQIHRGRRKRTAHCAERTESGEYFITNAGLIRP